MKKLNFTLLAIGCAILSLTTSCQAQNSKIEKFGRPTICTLSDTNTISNDSMGTSGHILIDLSETWNQVNNYDFPYLSPSYRGDGDIYLNIKNNGDTLISAHEVITFVPSVWGDILANVIQYIEISAFSIELSYPLKIEDGVVIYPAYDSNHNIANHINSLFSGLSKTEIYNAIKLDNNIDSNDKYYYLNYISDYKPGDFKYHNYGEKYNILDVMYSIKLTYIGKDGKYSKNITYSIVHGN
jgi:hypothetical protein